MVTHPVHTSQSFTILTNLTHPQVDRYNRLVVHGGKGAAAQPHTFQSTTTNTDTDSEHRPGLIHRVFGAAAAAPAAAAGAASAAEHALMRGPERVAHVARGGIHSAGDAAEGVLGEWWKCDLSYDETDPWVGCLLPWEPCLYPFPSPLS